MPRNLLLALSHDNARVSERGRIPYVIKFPSQPERPLAGGDGNGAGLGPKSLPPGMPVL